MVISSHEGIICGFYGILGQGLLGSIDGVFCDHDSCLSHFGPKERLKNHGHLIWTQNNPIPHIRTSNEDPQNNRNSFGMEYNTSTPKLLSKMPQIPSHMDHKALTGGTLGVAGKRAHFGHLGGPGTCQNSEVSQPPKPRRQAHGSSPPRSRRPRLHGVFKRKSRELHPA